MTKKTFVMIAVLLLILLTACTADIHTGSVAGFDYEEKEDGSIMITDYQGTDTNVVIPATIKGKRVTQIDVLAFFHNRTMVSVEIPDSVTFIDDRAFEACTLLSSVSLPQGLQSMGEGVFRGCEKLSAVTLPDTLTVLGEATFMSCTSLTHIRIPKGMTEIGRNAFLDSGLETVDWEEGIKTIGDDAFACTKIKAIILPQSVRKLASGAFYACANLESVTLNEGLTTIDWTVFGGPSKLTEIVIPASVTQMNEMTFQNSTTIEVVKFEGNAPENYQDEESERYKNTLKDLHYTVYYHASATGFTSPEWCGYQTAIW